MMFINITFLLILIDIKATGQLKIDNDSTSLVSYVDKIIVKANINTQKIRLIAKIELRTTTLVRIY